MQNLQNLINTLNTDKLKAMKDKDTLKYNLLCVLYSDCYMIGKNNGNRETTNDEVELIIKKYIKTINENLLIIKDDSIIEKYNKELEILKTYLPKQMSAKELLEAINAVIKSDSNVGSIMKELKTKFGNSFDGKLASTLIKERL